MLSFGEVFLAAVKAMASVVVIFLMGVGLAWKNILDQKAIRMLGGVCQKLFVPAISYSSIAAGMDVSYFKENWGLAVAGVTAVALGAGIGRLALPIAQPPPQFRPWFVLACAFPNMVAIPLVFIEAICKNESESTGEETECIENGQTKMFMFVLFFPVLIYGVGGSYAARAVQPVEPEPEASATDDAKPPPTAVAAMEADPAARADDIQVSIKNETGEPEPNPLGSSSAQPEFDDLEAPDGTELSLPQTTASGQKGGSIVTLGNGALYKEKSAPKVGSLRWQIQSIFLNNPPVLAVIAGLIVSCIEPLKDIFYGSSAPLSFFSNTVAILAKATPSIMNIIMAGALGLQLKKLGKVSHVFGGDSAGISKRTVLSLVFCKMVLVPAVLFSLLCLVQDSFPADRWYRLLLFIEVSSPTANTVVVLASILDQQEIAQQLALTCTSQLLIFLPAATLSTAAGMAMTQDLA